MDLVTLAEEWWQDAEGKPVPFGDPAGVSVLYGIGAVVPASVAESLKALSAPPSTKAIRGPRRAK